MFSKSVLVRGFGCTKGEVMAWLWASAAALEARLTAASPGSCSKAVAPMYRKHIFVNVIRVVNAFGWVS